MRCTRIKSNGERCGHTGIGWRIYEPGCGYKPTCPTHGGHRPSYMNSVRDWFGKWRARRGYLGPGRAAESPNLAMFARIEQEQADELARHEHQIERRRAERLLKETGYSQEAARERARELGFQTTHPERRARRHIERWLATNWPDHEPGTPRYVSALRYHLDKWIENGDSWLDGLPIKEPFFQSSRGSEFEEPEEW